MNKKFWIVLLIAMIALGGWIAYKTVEKANREAGRVRAGSGAIPVEVVNARRINMRDRRMFSGSLKPWSIYDVAPKVSGRLEMLAFDIGDPVRHGEVIARIDDLEYRQQYDQAAADLEVAKAQEKEAAAVFELRQKEAARQEQLDKNSIGSKAQLEAAQSALLSQQATHMMTEAEVERRTVALANAKLRLDYATIAADWNENRETPRFIGSRYVDEGTLLQVNQPIVSIAEIDRLRAAIYVIERDYPFLHAGQTAEITTDAYPGQTFYGKIDKISQVLQENSRQAYVLLEIPNADRKLKPGMFVVVHLEFGTHENAVAVPKSAVLNRNGREGVFLLSPDRTRAQYVEVQTGIRVDDMVQIIEPEIKQMVVTLGNHLLSDGVAVTAVSPAGEVLTPAVREKAE